MLNMANLLVEISGMDDSNKFGKCFSYILGRFGTKSSLFSPIPKHKIEMESISMGECNTILSAYTKYRHLG